MSNVENLKYLQIFDKFKESRKTEEYQKLKNQRFLEEIQRT